METASLIVVSGASSGIGEAIARRLAADGHRLILLARRAERLEALGAEIGADWYPVDLGDGEETLAVCTRILARHGVPDVIINNAGAGRFSSIEETSIEEAEAQIRLPYLAAFFLTRGLIEPMIERGSGTVLQINSPVAIVPWPGAVGYAAARSALDGFTTALRQDLWSTGVRVASVTPTRVHSDYFTANPGSRSRIPRAEILVGSMTPEQVADAVARALETRPGKDTYVGRRLALIERGARIAPGAVAALYRWTGHRRTRRRR